ncbi:hypothetical protein R5P08_004500 [Escherichia coli]|nr:hypothetical protein [Escherichia coli]ELE8699278.1 hypothetical protein [Escherichia coli]ELS5670781.1 hypothetical protein [Escherichia coli]MXG41338.1 hypothetical protein [Escherichia coli]MXG63894.1 hypothetical protein [Escherichia coli]
MATTRNKVMWQEGMLMRPHHFQQQQRYNDYRMLFRMGLQMMVADWEPSLLEQLEQKFTAEQ